MNKDIIEQKAYELLDKANLNCGEPVDVIRLAQNLGFAVGNIESKDDLDGFVVIDNNEDNLLGSESNKVIGVNADRDFYTKRFIIAHELGHFQLQYKNESLFARRDKRHGWNEKEDEIDFFAACLLMPANGFRKYYDKVKAEQPDRVIKVCIYVTVKTIPIETNAVSGIVALITAYGSVLGVFMGVIQIITKYVFPENEEQYITEIVKAIQENDLQHKKVNIEAERKKS